MSVAPAYIDPGTGSGLILALLIGAAITVAFIAALVGIILLIVRVARGGQRGASAHGFCSSCGNPLREPAAFCSKCGAAVNPTQQKK